MPARQPKGQERQELYQSAKNAKAKAIKPQLAPVKEGASTRPRARARASRTSTAKAQEHGAKEARALEKAKVKERSRKLMRPDGLMWAPILEEIGIGHRTPSGQQLRPPLDCPLQQLGRRRWRQPHPHG